MLPRVMAQAADAGFGKSPVVHRDDDAARSETAFVVQPRGW